jgi:hypothetical protein
MIKSPGLIKILRTSPVLLLFTLAAFGGGTTPSYAFGGYSRGDVVGTWACTYVLQGGRQSVPITANMNANGTADASATNSAGETGHSHFTWSYKPTGPSSGTLTTGGTGFGTIAWRGRNHAEVRRIRSGPGLLEVPYLDCVRT